MDLTLSAGGGYDDNPAELRGGTGAAFAKTRLDGRQRFSLEALPSFTFALQGFAVARCYENFSDTRQLGAELEGIWQFPETPGQLELALNVADFHNPEVEDEDFNQLGVALRLNRDLNARLSLGWEGSLNWEDYGPDSKNSQAPKPHPGNGKGVFDKSRQSHRPPHPEPPSRHHNQGERHDRVIGSSVDTLFAINPFIDTGAEIFWQNRHSSLDSEKSSTWGGQLKFFLHPQNDLQLEIALSAARTPYRYKLQGEKRTEKTYSSTINMNYDFNSHWSWSGGWEWFRQDSKTSDDEYSRNQWYTKIDFSY
jgi:outer membrane protein assembly factor BamA